MHVVHLVGPKLVKIRMYSQFFDIKQMHCAYALDACTCKLSFGHGIGTCMVWLTAQTTITTELYTRVSLGL